MTASLPVPNDIDPEEPDGHASARVVRLSDSVSPAPEKPRRPPPRTPRSDAGAKSAPRKKRPAAKKATIDPGPPPPLPSDLELADMAAAGIVVPPRPPLPETTEVDHALVDMPEPETVPEREPEPEPELETAPEHSPDTETTPEPELEPAPEPEPEPSPETATTPEPQLEPEAVPVPEADVEPAAGTSALAESADVVDAERVGEPAAGDEFAHVPEPDVASVLVAPESRVVPEARVEPAVVVPVTTPIAGDEPAPEAAASVPLGIPPLAATAEDALVLRGITKRFGSTHAVDGIDLTIPAGTFYGLVGPNGAGKTTTLSMIAGLIEPDRGTIHVAGVDAAAEPLAAKRLMGVLPDRLRTFDRLTGRQLLYYYGVLRGLPPAVVESRTGDLARAFDLADALGRSVSDYSAGMLKKVMLAGAMIHSPRLLVLDEPFEAVDPVSSAIILDILSTYVAHGGTVILSSHGMDLVERVCTRVAVIVAGQVLAEGTVDEVRGELTLEQRFVELAGGLSDVEGLEWLHTFSD